MDTPAIRVPARRPR